MTRFKTDGDRLTHIPAPPLLISLHGKSKAAARKLYGLIIKSLIQECGIQFYPSYPITITGGGNIRIGHRFNSMSNCYLYANDGILEIGNNITINTNVQLGASGGRIVIGNNVLIGPNVVLRAADHGIARSSIIQSQPPQGGEIIVEDDVWIGSNAVILRNVKLGLGCVVAAGAVVTGNVEPYVVVGGIPARKISERI